MNMMHESIQLIVLVVITNISFCVCVDPYIIINSTRFPIGDRENEEIKRTRERDAKLERGATRVAKIREVSPLCLYIPHIFFTCRKTSSK